VLQNQKNSQKVASLKSQSFNFFRVKYDFCPCKKKSLKNVLAKKICLKKVSGPTKTLKWHDFGHVAVADSATLATWHAT